MNIENGSAWDATGWAFDAATGHCTAKTYADNTANAYTYTGDGKPLRTTYASGRWRENAYNVRRELASVEYSDGETCLFNYDEFSHEVAASNSVAFVQLLRNDYGQVTNETATVGSESRTVEREFDAFGRLTYNDGSVYGYASDGRITSISNEIASVEYQYTTDRLDAGYTLSLSNGLLFARSLTRDGYRRPLVTGIESSVNNNVVESHAYTYDALNRPTARNADTFGYNDRSEVTNAVVAGMVWRIAVKNAHVAGLDVVVECLQTRNVPARQSLDNHHSRVVWRTFQFLDGIPEDNRHRDCKFHPGAHIAFAFVD